MNSAEIVEAMAQAMYERGEEWSPSTREHYLRQADAALTAIEARGMVVEQGWLPIETAPKDGTMFLAPNRHGAIDCVAWNEYGRFWDDGFGESEFEHYTPTHWRPLPSPPVDRTRGPA